MADYPKLSWDWGTAYDMFISLTVLHSPKEFGVRGSWASSVRKRLPTEMREVLEKSQSLVHVPFRWLYSLPAPKDAMTVLYSLRNIPASERLSVLTLQDESDDFAQIVRGVSAHGSWGDADLQAIQDLYSAEKGMKPSPDKKLGTILDGWAKAEEFGEQYLEALQTYHEVFFSEEEKRIKAALQSGLENAKASAEKLELPDLLEELSQGLRFTEMPELAELTLAPSYWVTPLMFFGKVSREQGIWMFGARPEMESVIPGEAVPDALLRALKALSDPTRLRIMHYLWKEALSPAELARRLRLRAPTVTHHLQALRLAGLVKVNLGGGYGKEKKSFAARNERVRETCEALGLYLEEGTTAASLEE